MTSNLNSIESIHLLAQQGVSISDIGQLVFANQEKYYPDIDGVELGEAINDVLSKRNTRYAIELAIFIDNQSALGVLPEFTQEALDIDRGVYGIDEHLARYICEGYGAIAWTNFAYIDKTKPGIIGEIDKRNHAVFLDDVVGAIVASASARIASKREAD